MADPVTHLQQLVDEALADLSAAVRVRFPVGTPVHVRTGRGEFAAVVVGVAVTRGSLVQVQVLPAYQTWHVRSATPRWYDYRLLRL